MVFLDLIDSIISLIKISHESNRNESTITTVEEIHQMETQNPNKILITVPYIDEYPCNEYSHMCLNALEKIFRF